MSKLSYKERKKMPKSKFALVEKENGKERKRFPINDKAHARNALARLPQAKGLSKYEKKMIKNKAQKKLYGTSDDKKINSKKSERERQSSMNTDQYRKYMKEKNKY